MIFFSLRMETEGQKYFLNLQKCAKDIATRIPAKSRNSPFLFQIELIKKQLYQTCYNHSRK